MNNTISASDRRTAARKPRAGLRMFVVVGIALLVFGAVFGMQAFSRKMMNEYLDKMPVPPVTITSAPAQAMSWDNRLEAIGTLVPINGADVTTEAGGIVSRIQFESGAQVKKGELLITLDSGTERGEYRRLLAQAELAEINRKRRQKLFELEAISKSDYDTALSEANAARAAAEAQSARLAQKEIRAPFDGVLGIRNVNVGQYLEPGSAIVSLQALDPIDLDFSLPEQYLGIAQPGLKITARVDAYPNDRFAGEVMAVEPRIDQGTRNFKLRARLPNPDNKLRGGQFGRVELALPGGQAVIAVPTTAINYNSYGASVFLVQKKKDAPPPPDKPMPGAPPHTDLEVTQRFVRTGEARGDFVAVIEGLKPGEQVATSGLLKLRNQQPVIIDNSVTPKPELSPNVPNT
jgi:membrane fusion protein (multidrug efflux system)